MFKLEAYLLMTLLALAPLAVNWANFQLAKKKDAPLKHFLLESNNAINDDLTKFMPVIFIFTPLLFLIKPDELFNLSSGLLFLAFVYPASGIAAIKYYKYCLLELEKLDKAHSIEELTGKEPRYYFNFSFEISVVIGLFIICSILAFLGYFEWLESFEHSIEQK